ncbi:MAG: aspartate--tRNA ligase [Leptospirales bacterium]
MAKKAVSKATKKTAKKTAKKAVNQAGKKTSKKTSKKTAPAKSGPRASSAPSGRTAQGVRELAGGPDLIADIFANRTPAGDLTVAAAGRTVGVSGWAFRYRDQGGCVFVDLRERSGLIQLVFDQSTIPEKFAVAERIRSEYVLAVVGVVRKRTPENINPRLKSGEIEILVKDFEVLNAAETPPFELDEHHEVHEELRLKYRYMDMRREGLSKALYMRSRLNQSIRRYLEDEGFLEVETPVLNKSTPEGARDFLVPARMTPGTFYALPQSPQLFKQILMVGGLERYFQIVKCFRDEDLRADRQPEFTQLDMEISFTTEDQIVELIEQMWARVIQECFDVELQLPLPQLSYQDAMERYGVDAPDVRFAMELRDVAELVQKSEFQVFHSVLKSGGRVKALAVPGGAQLSRKDVDDLTDWASRNFGARGLAFIKHEEEGLKSAITKFFSPELLKEMADYLGTKPGDMIFFGAGPEQIVNATLGNLRVRLAKRFDMIPEGQWAFTWVRDFPLFERDHKTGDIYSVHHPFTAPHEDQLDIVMDPERFKKEATKVLSRAYDLVLNGSEIGGGSIRIHKPEVQHAVFKALGISDAEVEEKFGFFVDALKYGAPPHGGIAFGLDRVMMLFLQRESIRDVIAFPKTQKGHCLMSESPSAVSPVQLQELAIKTVPVPGS